MSEHLPECWVKYESDPTAWCLCDELLACEERVMDTAVRRLWDYLQHDVADNWMPRSKADGIIVALKGDKP